MFSTLTARSLSYLALGAQAHNRLNTALIDDIVAMMARCDWTCAICGIRIEGLMEVHHAGGHSLDGRGGMRPICQFCHDRDHLVWAAARKRVTLIHAPDLSHEDISRLAWARVLHEGREGFALDARRVARDLTARREDAFDALGHDNLEAAIEALYAYRDARGGDAAAEIGRTIDAHIRVAPTALLSEEPGLETWRRGGFRPLEEGWRDRAIPTGFPDYATLAAAGASLRARL